MKIVVGELEKLFGTVETGPKEFIYTPARPTALSSLQSFATDVPPGLDGKSQEEVLEYLIRHRRGQVWCMQVPDSWRNGDSLSFETNSNPNQLRDSSGRWTSDAASSAGLKHDTPWEIVHDRLLDEGRASEAQKLKSKVERIVDNPTGQLHGGLKEESKELESQRNTLRDELEKKYGKVRRDWPRSKEVKRKANELERLTNSMWETVGEGIHAETGWKSLKNLGYTKDTIKSVTPEHVDAVKAAIRNLGGAHHLSSEVLSSTANEIIKHYDYDPDKSAHN